MPTIPTWAIKAVAGVLLAAGLIGGAFWYRSHVYNEGYAAGQAAEKQKNAAAIAFAQTTDKLISDQAEAGLRTQLKDETNAHKARTSALEAALADARADGIRLSEQLARLHNDAIAGSGPSAAGTAPGAGSKGDSAAPAVLAGPGQFSLADLMLNDETNFTICRKNAERLTAIQDWYTAVRKGDKAAEARAVAEAPAE